MVKFNPRPIRGTTAMESPKESAIRSMRSISLFFGKSVAIKQYPGKKSTRGRVSKILSVVAFRRGR